MDFILGFKKEIQYAENHDRIFEWTVPLMNELQKVHEAPCVCVCESGENSPQRLICSCSVLLYSVFFFVVSEGMEGGGDVLISPLPSVTRSTFLSLSFPPPPALSSHLFSWAQSERQRPPRPLGGRPYCTRSDRQRSSACTIEFFLQCYYDCVPDRCIFYLARTCVCVWRCILRILQNAGGGLGFLVFNGRIVPR